MKLYLFPTNGRPSKKLIKLSRIRIIHVPYAYVTGQILLQNVDIISIYNVYLSGSKEIRSALFANHRI